jgi:hypothetical protein
MNAAKKKKTTKKKIAKIPSKKENSSPKHKTLKGRFNGFKTEEAEKEYNHKIKAIWYQYVSRELRLKHEERLKIKKDPLFLLKFLIARLTTKNCKYNI